MLKVIKITFNMLRENFYKSVKKIYKPERTNNCRYHWLRKSDIEGIATKRNGMIKDRADKQIPDIIQIKHVEIENQAFKLEKIIQPGKLRKYLFLEFCRQILHI